MSALVEPRAGAADDPSPIPARYPVDQATEMVEPGSGALAVRAAADSPRSLRIDFGAHFESNYQRLVAQLYAITLDAGQAHDAVQDAYARAWRRWATVGRTADPSAWVRSVAVRSTIRSWRSLLARVGIGRPRPERANIDPRTRTMLSALRRLPVAERRALVLTYMAGSSVDEIAAIEQISPNAIRARLSRGRRLITENLADDLPALLEAGSWPGEPHRDPGERR